MSTAIPQITRNLQPGMSGTDIQQLQQFLISQGYAIPDGATGYYGDQTKAAVTEWQKKTGVQPAQASDYGYFGPLSRQALAGAGATPTPGATTEHDAQLGGLLNDPTLSADQKHALTSIYDAVSSNDQSYADRIKAGIAAASTYSDPFFKAQTRMVTDALDRSFKATEGDLGYQSNQLNNTLADLRTNIEASKESMSLDEQQQLRDLERHYTTQLADTHDNLASRGLSSSSIRAQSDKLLGDSYGDMRQTAQRQLTDRTSALDRNLATAGRDTQLELARLQDLASRGKIAALRTAEGQTGSKTLQDLGYNGLLGDQGGAIPRAKEQDALNFANSYVF